MSKPTKMTKLRDIPEVKKQLNSGESYLAPLVGKKFEDLTGDEKDRLLKLIAIKLNILPGGE